MDVLAVILLIVLLFVIISFRTSVSNKLQRLDFEIKRLQDQLSKNAVPRPPAEAPPAAAAPPPPPPIKKEPEYWESAFKVYEETVKPPAAKADPPQQAHEPTQKGPVSAPPRRVPPPPPPRPPAPPQPSFFERHPDLEKFIGENLINKIGIAILVLAIGFFVKYAIDNNWINPIGRVGIGILCGGILVGLAHRLHKNYKAFSSVLVGGGLAIFYFTITLAYHQFHLFDQTTSFIIMVVITAFAVVLSLLYNRQELAIIALVGGFVAPFLVSNGSNNYKALFGYLLILNTGLLIMAYNKAWRLLNFLSFIFTALLVGSWIVTLPYKAPYDTYRNGLLFATAFYLLFFIINIANNIKENKKFIASDFSILLANTALYFAAGLYFITMMQADNYRGLFTAAMGIFNLGASFILFRKQRIDRNVLYLLIGLTLTFVSLTAPIQLHGNYITLFWASEAVLLYWLFQRSKIVVILGASVIVWVAMIISLVMDWANIYSNPLAPLPIVFNKGFITTVYSAIATYALFMLRGKDDAEKNVYNNFVPGKGLLRAIGLVLLFIAGALEINHQFVYYYPAMQLNVQYLLLYVFAFITLFSLINARRSPASWPLQLALLFLGLFVYLCSVQTTDSLLHQMLDQGKYGSHFAAHWAGAVLTGFIFYCTVRLVRKQLGESKQLALLCWLLCGWVVIYVSIEAGFMVSTVCYSGRESWYRVNDVFVKTGLPILWGLCSFAFMWLGMRIKFRPLRIVSLTLFSITLVKLFVYDIRNIPPGGKIAAFFCLGVLLLVVSFMYQRLKRIIIEDEKKLAE